jgi:hypothetical protein
MAGSESQSLVAATTDLEKRGSVELFLAPPPQPSRLRLPVANSRCDALPPCRTVLHTHTGGDGRFAVAFVLRHVFELARLDVSKAHETHGLSALLSAFGFSSLKRLSPHQKVSFEQAALRAVETSATYRPGASVPRDICACTQFA